MARRKSRLGSRYLSAIDPARHRADSRSSYEAYFAIVDQKVEEYKVYADNIYNMDEKGSLIGKLRKTRTIFTRRESYKRGTLTVACHDDSRECITDVALVCADAPVCRQL
jgi:hypothetical protein